MASKLIIRIVSQDFTRAGFEKAGTRVKALEAGLQAANRRMKKLGLAAVGVGAVAVNAFAKFDRGVREITTLLGTQTISQFKLLGDELKASSVQFGQSIESMTKARYDIISAGFTNAAASAEVLAASSKLAVAGVSTVAKTADVITTVLNAYGASSKDAAKMSDILFTTVRLGKTTVDQLASSFGNAVSIAPALGVSVEEIAAALATLTARGISTDEAVTAVQATMVGLIKPSDELTAKLKLMGYNSGSAAIAALGLDGVLAKLGENATQADLATYFPNVRSMKAVFPLVGSSAKKFSENLEEIRNSAGSTDAAFAQMAAGLGFQMDQAKQTISNGMISIGENLAPVAKGLATLVTHISEMGPAGGRMLATLIPLTAAVWAFSGAITAAWGPVGILVALVGVAAITAFNAQTTAAERTTMAVSDYIKAVQLLDLVKITEEEKILAEELGKSAEKYRELEAAAAAAKLTASDAGQGMGNLYELHNQRVETAAEKVKELSLKYVALVNIKNNLIDTTEAEASKQQAAIDLAIKKAEALIEAEKNATETKKEAAFEAKAAAYAAIQDRQLAIEITEQSLNEELGMFDSFAMEKYSNGLKYDEAALQQVDRLGLLKAEIYGKWLDEEIRKESEAMQKRSLIWATGSQMYDALLTDLIYGVDVSEKESKLDRLKDQLQEATLSLEALQQADRNSKLFDNEKNIENIKNVKDRIGELEVGIVKVNKQIDHARDPVTRLKKAWSAASKDILFRMGQIIKQEIANAIVRKTVMASSQAAAVATGIATAATLAGAYAVPAAFAATMSFGGAAVAGETGILSITALTSALALFAKGGIVPDSSRRLLQVGTDSVPALLTPGEAVIPKQTVQNNPLLIDSLLNGRGVYNTPTKSGGMNVTFNVQAVDAASFSDLLRSDAFRNTFDDLLNSRSINLRVENNNVRSLL